MVALAPNVENQNQLITLKLGTQGTDGVGVGMGGGAETGAAPLLSRVALCRNRFSSYFF